MTRKDYVLLARLIAQHKGYSPEMFAFAYDLAYELGETNPQFDSTRFIQACGLNSIEVQARLECVSVAEVLSKMKGK